ncbi:DUF5123 domain-containing protein [candidate division KSB1 bacterium]|nr:DUF5123 domain-containing protein [candidate division KSB1 bacterium]
MKKNLLMLLIFTLLGSLVFAQNKIPVAPGEGTLSQAVLNAQNGDILQLIPDASYTESTNFNFGTLKGISITIEVDGDGSTKAKLQVLTAPTDASTTAFFYLADKSSLTLRGLELDGSLNSVPSASSLINFSMGDTPAPMAVGTIRIENCFIHDLKSNVINSGNGDQAGNVLVDSTIIDNTIMQTTGTSVYYKYAGSNFISVINSTFNTINSYGLRIAGPGYTFLPDNTPEVIIDQTTWYNIGTTDGREILLSEKGPLMKPWTVSNSIFVKEVEKTKTVINIKETDGDSLAKISNICLWDVGKKAWRSHSVQDTITMDPQFADPANGDFTLPAGSKLLTFGTNGGPIGDRRWATNATGVEKIKETEPVKNFSLNQNYPNPFNPTTTITFRLENAGMTNLSVYDLSGREIAVLVNKNLAPGTYQYHFDARNLTTGVYLYKLQSSGILLTRKMMFLK